MIDIRIAYMANQESIEEELDSIEEERREGYNIVIQARSTAERIFGLLGQLSGAKATLEETLAAMKEVGEQIEEGEAALAEGKAQLNTAKEQQKKKAEELDNKKRDLDQQEKALKQSTELAEEQKKLEEREKALRTALLSREEIRRRRQYGEELLSASEHWLAEYTDQTAERYRDRFDASLLMIVCAILAFAGALTSFGENFSCTPSPAHGAGNQLVCHCVRRNCGNGADSHDSVDAAPSPGGCADGAWNKAIE